MPGRVPGPQTEPACSSLARPQPRRRPDEPGQGMLGQLTALGQRSCFCLGSEPSRKALVSGLDPRWARGPRVMFWGAVCGGRDSTKPRCGCQGLLSPPGHLSVPPGKVRSEDGFHLRGLGGIRGTSTSEVLSATWLAHGQPSKVQAMNAGCISKSSSGLGRHLGACGACELGRVTLPRTEDTAGQVPMSLGTLRGNEVIACEKPSHPCTHPGNKASLTSFWGPLLARSVEQEPRFRGFLSFSSIWVWRFFKIKMPRIWFSNIDF